MKPKPRRRKPFSYICMHCSQEFTTSERQAAAECPHCGFIHLEKVQIDTRMRSKENQGLITGLVA